MNSGTWWDHDRGAIWEFSKVARWDRDSMWRVKCLILVYEYVSVENSASKCNWAFNGYSYGPRPKESRHMNMLIIERYIETGDMKRG